MVDEFGQVLQGSSPSAPYFGNLYVEGDLVQVLLAPDGVIYPPAADGTPDARNQLLMETRVGQGISPSLQASGQFAVNVSPRPGGNSRIFARVFNATEASEASFYGDSQLYTVKSWKNETFWAEITSTATPLDAYDSDGDGLNNSWEKSYGTDKHSADTDGDGMSDADETAAGTDPLDEQSLVAISLFQDDRAGKGSRGSSDNAFSCARLRWKSKGGYRYKVEYNSAGHSDHATYELIQDVTASGDSSEVQVPANYLDRPWGIFRVTVQKGNGG